MVPPTGRVTRSAGKKAAAPPSVPTPPTTGRPGSKRARKTVEEDVSDTPVKKNKGKAEAKEVVAADEEEPELEDLGEEEEEEAGDADRCDPEGDALNDDEDEDGVDDEEGVDEKEDEEGEVEVVDLEEYTGLARRVEKKAGSRRKRRAPIYLDRAVASFTAISIGKSGGLGMQSYAVIKECLIEFRDRMQKSIRQRSALANSHRRDDPTFPMSCRMRQYFISNSAQQIWKMVRDTVSQGRQIVLGGIWTGAYTFEDLPPPTEEELGMWLVYADLVTNADTQGMYVGSATARQKAGFGFSRLGQYEKAKQRANNDEDVRNETEKSRHLRAALQKGAVMELRIIAVFDPLKVTVALPLVMEGLFVDYLQSFNRSWVYRRENVSFSSPECLSSYNAAAEHDALWTGLNGAHPFKQGIRGDSLKRRCILAQDETCEICYRKTPGITRNSFWIPSDRVSHLLECTNDWVCYLCVRRADTNPEFSLEQIRVIRCGSTQENTTNIRAFRSFGVSAAEVDAQLEVMGHVCPCCNVKGPERGDVEHFHANWRPMRPAWASRLGGADWICAMCTKALDRHIGEGMSVKKAIEHRRQFQTLKNDAGGDRYAARSERLLQAKFDLAMAQEGECPVCQTIKWPVTTTTVKDMSPTQDRQMPESWSGNGSTRPLACKPCYDWYQSVKDKSNYSSLLDKRRAQFADKEDEEDEEAEDE
jgi:hypothetical protein